MISRSRRQKTRTERLKRQKRNAIKKHLSSFLTFAVAAIACGTAALAAPEITDRPTDAEMAALMASNGAFAGAVNKNEAFVAGEKTGIGLCSFAYKACDEHWNYVYGGKGQRMNTSVLTSIVLSNLNDARSPYLRDGYIASTMTQVGKRATDCSGLVMNYMWWAGDDSDPIQALCPSIGGYNANAMLEAAVEKGPISSMPEIPGLIVHSNGHVGIYIGNGEVIEARGVKYGVTKTRLSERGFRYWSKSPWIDYELSGIYEIAGRYVFLDDGVDIGKDRWVAKYVFGNSLAGSTYTPICDSSATFGGALPAVYDADATASEGKQLELVDRILAVIDTLEYDPRYGYKFEGHWYVIQVDGTGMPNAYINDPTEGEAPVEQDAVEIIQPSDDIAWGGTDSQPVQDDGPITYAPEPIGAAPNPVPDPVTETEPAPDPQPADDASDYETYEDPGEELSED